MAFPKNIWGHGIPEDLEVKANKFVLKLSSAMRTVFKNSILHNSTPLIKADFWCRV